MIFDIGGVIVEYKRENYLKLFEYNEQEKQTLLKEVIFTPNWNLLLKGEISNDEFVTSATEKHPEFAKEINLFFDSEILKSMLPPIKETFEFVKKLKNAGLKLFVISDIDEITIKYILSAIDGFENLFDDIIYSCRVGMIKKDGDIFDLAIQRFKIVPEETLFIDDSVKNLDQAKLRNLNIFQFEHPSENIKELENLLKIN